MSHHRLYYLRVRSRHRQPCAAGVPQRMKVDQFAFVVGVCQEVALLPLSIFLRILYTAASTASGKDRPGFLFLRFCAFNFFDCGTGKGRNGLLGLEQRIEVNSPLDLVILMLGTNDFQSMHDNNAWHSSQGIAAIVRAIRTRRWTA